MSTVNVTDLPGIGRRYSLQLDDGMLVIIVHHSGEREVYLFDDPDADEARASVSMSDEEARKIGAVFLGADYQPISEDKIDHFYNTVRLFWIRVHSNSNLAHRTIEHMNVRQRTGATIIGIQRGDEMIGSPDPDTEILPGDVLLVVGGTSHVKELEQLCRVDSRDK